jgi:uncharacterized protein DUF6518
MLVAFLAALVARRPLDGALSAVLALIAMLVGYSFAIEVRGFEHSTRSIAFWGLAAIVAGGPIGVSASWVRFGRPTLAAIGGAVPVGLLIGEGVYGLRSLSETTSPGFWIAEIVLGVLLASLVAATRLRGERSILLMLGATAAVAGAFLLVSSLDLISVV